MHRYLVEVVDRNGVARAQSISRTTLIIELLGSLLPELLALKIDKTDLAAALLRQEMRGHMRSLDAGARFALVTADEAFLHAALEAPPSLSGLSLERRDQAVRFFLDKNFPDELAEFEETETALEVFNMAVDSALKSLEDTMRFPHNKAFGEYMEAASKNLEEDWYGRELTKVTAEMSARQTA